MRNCVLSNVTFLLSQPKLFFSIWEHFNFEIYKSEMKIYRNVYMFLIRIIHLMRNLRINTFIYVIRNIIFYWLFEHHHQKILSKVIFICKILGTSKQSTYITIHFLISCFALPSSFWCRMIFEMSFCKVGFDYLRTWLRCIPLNDYICSSITSSMGFCVWGQLLGHFPKSIKKNNFINLRMYNQPSS